MDSLRGTREAPGRQERTNWTAWEAPGRQERTNWTACEAPGRHQGGRKGPLDSLGGTREAPGPVKGKSVRREGLVPSLKRKIIFGK